VRCLATCRTLFQGICTTDINGRSSHPFRRCAHTCLAVPNAHWLVLELFRGCVWQGSPGAGATDGVTSPDARYPRSRSRVADLMLFIHPPTVIVRLAPKSKSLTHNSIPVADQDFTLPRPNGSVIRRHTILQWSAAVDTLLTAGAGT
jgi:hypothetical protein